MKIFVAGASGALGKSLVPQLVANGHEVTGMTRTAAKADAIRAQGAEAVVADGLDRTAVMRAVAAAEPDVVVHQMTALGGDIDMRKIDQSFELTNRLRTEGTDTLIAAARAAGAGRLVAQSFAGWPFARAGGPIKSEEAPLDTDPPARMRAILEGIKHVERAVTEAEGLDGLVLRYGGFYGPGTGLDRGAPQAVEVGKRKFPVVGSGGGIWSFIHIDDAAEATVKAIEGGAPGIYNIVDDDPAPVAEWLPALAQTIGAPPPRRIPAFVVRLAAGAHAVTMMTAIRGASNEKAKRELGWQPRRASWREGFEEVFAQPAAVAA